MMQHRARDLDPARFAAGETPDFLVRLPGQASAFDFGGDTRAGFTPRQPV
jgi:hypothetical protein